MRGLDSKVRAQKIYMSHMQQTLLNDKTGQKRMKSKKNMVVPAHGHGLKPNERLTVTEAVRTSRAKLNESEQKL